MIRYIAIFIFTLMNYTTFGQSNYPLYKNYDWVIDSKHIDLPEEDKEETEVILKSKTIKEYEYQYNTIVEYNTIHKIIYLNSDDAIERNNRIYIYAGDGIELVSAKARVIKKNGETQYFDTENILESDELDENGAYKYFPLDGMELNSNVEFLYTIKKSPNFNGLRYSMQEEYNMYDVSFDIVTPSNLLLGFKSYNDCPKVSFDSLDDVKNHYTIHSEKTKKLASEKYSAYKANLKYFVFKLDENTSTGSKNLITIENMAQQVFKKITNDVSKKEIKSAQKYLSKLNISDALSTEEKIRQLESKLKNEIRIYDAIPYVDVTLTLQNKLTSSFGSARLFVLLLKEMDIDYEFGFSINRFSKTFDTDFPSYYLYDELFFYFPEIEAYMNPSDNSNRVGFYDGIYSNTDAVHIKTIKVGGFESGLGQVKFIPSIAYNNNIDQMDVKIDLADFDLTTIEFERQLTGYQAIGLQTTFQYMNDQREETNIAYCKFTDDEGELLDYTVENDSSVDAGFKPLIYKGKLTSDRYITNAGSNYLLKIGLAIGSQSQLYSEKERKLPVVNYFNRGYKRTITFEIPEGYTCKNLDILNVNQHYPIDNPTCQFVSSYKQEGNTISIDVLEFYNQIDYSVEEYPEFQKTINAAADFNKLTLILEPK